MSGEYPWCRPWDSLLREGREFLARPGFDLSAYEAFMRRVFTFMQSQEPNERVRMVIEFMALTESGRRTCERLAEIFERNGTVTEQEFEEAVAATWPEMNAGEQRGFTLGQQIAEDIARKDGRN